MKKSIKTYKIEIKVPEFTDIAGKNFTLSDEYIKNYINHIIEEFNSFKVDKRKLKKYDEDNEDTYPHFVHHYLREWYTSAENSNHSYNGGNYQFENYNPLTLRHKRMLDHSFDNHELDCSVKDRIIHHLVSGGGTRGYGYGLSFKCVNLNEGHLLSEEEAEEEHNRLLEFFEFTLGTGMFDINAPLSSKNIFKDGYDNEEGSNTVAELFILQCWRSNYDLKALQVLVDKYALDLDKVSKIKRPFDKEGINYSFYSYLFSCMLRGGDFLSFGNKIDYIPKEVIDRDHSIPWKWEMIQALKKFFDFFGNVEFERYITWCDEGVETIKTNLQDFVVYTINDRPYAPHPNIQKEFMEYVFNIELSLVEN